MTTGQKIRVLTVVDTFSRFSPSSIQGSAIWPKTVIATLERVCVATGFPKTIRVEAFNGRLRAECLNAHWFLTLADAREKLEDWRKYYNEARPHGAIGNKRPVSLMTPFGAASPPA